MFDTFVQIISPNKTLLVPTLVHTWIVQGKYLGNRRLRRVNGQFEPTNFVMLDKATITRNQGLMTNIREGVQALPAVADYSETTVFEQKARDLRTPDRLRIDIRKTDKFLCKGMKVIVTDDNLLSYNTKGKLLGFTCSRAGNILAHIDYLEGAAPLTISVDKISICLPRKRWMVQEVVDDNTQSRTVELMNGIHNNLFSSLVQAQNTARSLSQRTSDKEYLILEVIQVTTEFGLETYPVTH